MGGLRACLLGSFGVSLVAALGACGGRSSMLDPDAVYLYPSRPSGSSTSDGSKSGSKPNTGIGTPGSSNGSKGGAPASSTGGTSAGSTGGGPAAGGTSGVGTGGSGTGGSGTGGSGTGGIGGTAGSTPAGGSSAGGAPGAGGATGLDPWVASRCTEFCSPKAQAACPSTVSSTDCAAACQAEFADTGPSCQKAGGVLLECLTTVYQNSKSCGDVAQLSLAKCGSLFADYQSCDPTMKPELMPTPDPSTCSATGSVAAGKCGVDVMCESGAHYNVYCYATSPDQLSCSCNATYPDGSATGSSFGLNENEAFACEDSLSLCGFPQFR